MGLLQMSFQNIGRATSGQLCISTRILVLDSVKTVWTMQLIKQLPNYQLTKLWNGNLKPCILNTDSI